MGSYVNDKDGYQGYIPSSKKIIKSHDVDFKLKRVGNWSATDIYVHNDQEIGEDPPQRQEKGPSKDKNNFNEEIYTTFRQSDPMRNKRNWQISGEFICAAEIALVRLSRGCPIFGKYKIE